MTAAIRTGLSEVYIFNLGKSSVLFKEWMTAARTGYSEVYILKGGFGIISDIIIYLRSAKFDHHLVDN